MARTASLKVNAQEWRAKLQEHPLEIEGAFIRFLSKAHLAEGKSELTLTVAQWARLFGVDAENAARIIRYLVEENLASSPVGIADITERYNPGITVSVYTSPSAENTRQKENEKQAAQQAKMREERERVRVKLDGMGVFLAVESEMRERTGKTFGRWTLSDSSLALSIGRELAAKNPPGAPERSLLGGEE